MGAFHAHATIRNPVPAFSTMCVERQLTCVNSALPLHIQRVSLLTEGKITHDAICESIDDRVHVDRGSVASVKVTFDIYCISSDTVLVIFHS